MRLSFDPCLLGVTSPAYDADRRYTRPTRSAPPTRVCRAGVARGNKRKRSLGFERVEVVMWCSGSQGDRFRLPIRDPQHYSEYLRNWVGRLAAIIAVRPRVVKILENNTVAIYLRGGFDWQDASIVLAELRLRY